MAVTDRTTANRAPGPRTRPARPSRTTAATTASRDRGMPGVAVLFLVMLLIPWSIQISGVVMTPFRFFLLIAIIPLTARLLAGRAGPLTKIDGLIFAASGWKVLSDFVHYPELGTVELAGSQFVEFFGAYVVGRTTIRSAADMRVFVRWTFYSLFVLM